MSSIERFFVALFVLFLLLPGAQMIFGFVPEEPLHGVEAPQERALPPFDLAGFLTESFQADFMLWLNEHFGFRGHLVRTDNQLNFSVFREISSSYNSRIVVGKSNTLYEKLYIDAANGTHRVSEKNLRFVARQFLRLSRTFASLNKTFIVLITPSKASLYNELIPQRFLRYPGRSLSSENADLFVDLLVKAGVPVLDTRKLLQLWKQDSAYELFGRGGAHWTEITACRVGRELMRTARRMSGRDFRELTCEPIRVSEIPGPFDRDLADLTNVWNPLPFFTPLPYVDLSKAPPPHGEQPSMFFVGGSFLWALLNQFEQQSIYRSREFFYYYERRFRWPERTSERIRKTAIPWREEVLPNDIFVVEINEAYLHHAGMGFVRDAIRSLAPGAAAGRGRSEASATGRASRTQ